jgi:hypothetical protein
MAIKPEETKRQIEEIIAIVEQLPEKYRDKTFELLMAKMLAGPLQPILQQVIPQESKEPVPIEGRKYILPIEVRAFLKQFDFTDVILSRLFFIEGEEIRSIYAIDTVSKSKAQIQISLFVALENAIRNGKFEFSIEEVRRRATDFKVYDVPNFSANFRNNLKLFKSLEDREHVELTTEGKTQLAEYIGELSK